MRHRDALDEDSVRRLERNPLRILDSKNPEMRELIAEAPVLADYLDDESRGHFERLQAALRDVRVPFSLNPRLVRGLDYYTRTVFEWVTDRLGAQSAVCSGGRYDGLVAELGGRATPAVGWALGVERVVELLRVEGRAKGEAVPDVFVVASGERARRASFATVEALRDRVPGLRLSAGTPTSGFKAQLRRADKSGARLALILGDEEIDAGKLSVKPLREEAPQRLLTLDELVQELQRGRNP